MWAGQQSLKKEVEGGYAAAASKEKDWRKKNIDGTGLGRGGDL